MWLCVYARRGIASRTRSIVACSPNISVPISTERIPPSRYSSFASATPGNCARSFIRVAWFAQFDEVRIFREPARIDIERNFVLLADGFYRTDIFHRDGLAAPGIVGYRQHDQRNVLRAFAFDGFREPRR